MDELRATLRRAWWRVEDWILALAADWPGRCMIYVTGYLLVVVLTLLVVWFVGLR
jgi:hypothetical protein